MNLTRRHRRWVPISLHLVIPFLFVMTGFTQTTCTNQSPRDVTYLPESKRAPYNYLSGTALVVPNLSQPWPEAIYYQKQTLLRCDQHYHVPVENTQGCPGERSSGSQKGKETPPVGQWIELHTVYALQVSNDTKCADHLDHDLKCCLAPPFVVVAFSAKVAGDQSPVPPVIQPPKPPEVKLISEWSGSTTGPDDATKCKPTPAQWNFAQGCNFTVPRNQLEQLFHEAHPARDVQTGNLVSRDLTLVSSETDPNLTCQQLRTGVISDNTEAQRLCPGVCSLGGLPRFRGDWTNVPPPPNSKYAVCTCCAPYRPQ